MIGGFDGWIGSKIWPERPSADADENRSVIVRASRMGQNANSHGVQRSPRADVFEMVSRSRGPAVPCPYAAEFFNDSLHRGRLI